MLRRGSGVPLDLGSWQAPRFYIYEAGEVTGVPKDLLCIKECAWGPAAAQVGPAPVFLGKHLELQATRANRTPLRGRKTIELGAGCGLVSMVAALLGADAHACEDSGPTLALLQHNVATFNSEFTRCSPIRACEFPTCDNLRNHFDILFVTDLLNSPSARIKTLQCLLHLLGPKTECIVVHTWRSAEVEKIFFEALGRCLLVSRLDGQRDIQKRCIQAISRSIADSARDIHEATDEDGSIDIFSVKPPDDVSESVWRSKVKGLLVQLLGEEAKQKCLENGNSDVNPSPIEATGATVGEAAALWSEKEDNDGNTASLSSYSTLSSVRGGVQLAPFRSSSEVLTNAEQQAPGEGIQQKLESLSRSETAESRPATVLDPATRSGTNASSRPGLLRNLSQPVLHHLPLEHTNTAAKPKSSNTARNGAPAATVSSLEPAPSADGKQKRPMTSTTAKADASGGGPRMRQRMLVNNDESPNKRKLSATASNGSISLRSTKGRGSPCPASPFQTLQATAAAAVKPTAPVQGKILPSKLKSTPPECNGEKQYTSSATASKTAGRAAAFQRATTARLNSTATGTANLRKNSADKTSADGTTDPLEPAIVRGATTESVVAAKSAVQKVSKPARPPTSLPPTQQYHKRLGPLTPGWGAPNVQPRRPTAEGSPTATQEATAAYTHLRSGRKSSLVNATNTPGATATAASTTAAAATALHQQLTPGSAFALDRCTAPRTGGSHPMLKAASVAAAGPTSRLVSGAGSGVSQYPSISSGGSPRISSATVAAPRPVVGPTQADNAVAGSAKTTPAVAYQPTSATGGEAKAAAVATEAREKPDKPRGPVEAKRSAVSGGSNTATGPLGARLVSRLSGLFKRSGSKETDNKLRRLRGL